MAKNANIASVLAFEKKLVPSDGFMYGTTWQERNKPESNKPLVLREKSVRGTISNRLKPAIKDDPLKLNAEVEKPNLQRVDSCALGEDQDTLKLHFTLKVLSGVQTPSACNNKAFNETYSQAANDYIATEGFKALAKRYAINIANARFLWRNRVGAEHIEVQVKKLNQNSEKNWTFDAVKIGLRDFETTSPDIDELAAEIAKALSGEEDFLLLEISAFAQIGFAQDVYPSEELVLDKSTAKDKKSKILYHINNVAGMHSQKIGNALRTIDTWYPAYPETQAPIAIEPYGAVTNLGIAYRNPKAKADFFTLFDRFACSETLATKEDAHYVMAVLVRGGVFGESGKD
ncbi:CRISPR-associated protein Csy3 [Methylomonas lenta]|uniref:CRISPR-associated protein Csy3 n=1 Tax=Methylomonas lenta TaxID=980561 RepID=A0A177NTY3_9GAMM|nr:type I-F CRISPR-associated protein Csy3 [Methylomonas lenta]OAI20540.1 CRISPR-associated protein Csy3 [Methylomonas lenta]